jgi:hypothetical protein
MLVKTLFKASTDKELAAKNGRRAIDFARQYVHKNMVEVLAKQDRMIDI